MKRVSLILIFGIFSIVLQSSVLKIILPDGFVPNFIVILLVFIAFHESSPMGAVIAFLLGMECDIYSGQLIGPYAAASVAVFCVLSSLSQRIFIDSPFAVLLTVFIALCFYNLVFILVVSGFTEVESLLWEMLRLTPIEAVTTSVVAVLLFRPIQELWEGRRKAYV